MKYAVVDNGRNQAIIKPGESVLVDAQGLEEGSEYKWEKVLLIRNGENLDIGRPYIKDASVSGIVRGGLKGPKVVNFKKKRRKGYTRKVGHRQSFTEVFVEEI